MARRAISTGSSQSADGKLEYDVMPGVEWVNGKRVGDEKTVRLTDAEALYDRSLGRIALKAAGVDGGI